MRESEKWEEDGASSSFGSVAAGAARGYDWLEKGGVVPAVESRKLRQVVSVIDIERRQQDQEQSGKALWPFHCMMWLISPE